MSKVTQQEVFEVAQAIAEQGQTPTQQAIRAHLGRGSNGTIHKYLKQWKETCFQKAATAVSKEDVFTAIDMLSELGAKITVGAIREELGHGSFHAIERYLRMWQEGFEEPKKDQTLFKVKQLEKKCEALESQLLSQSQKVESLSAQLFEREKTLIGVEKKLEQERQALIASKLENDKVTTLNQTLTAEREQIVESLIKAQQDQEARFCEDLKAINQMGLEQVREASMQGQEAWLEEKIKTRALNEKLEQLAREKMEVQKQLDKERQMNQPLRKRLADQEKLIGNCLDPKKVDAFRLQEETQR